MSDKTKIEWTDATWNPLRGCSRVSEGCRHCYAENLAARFSDEGQWGHGLATRTPDGSRWTGKIILDQGTLLKPLKWKRPRKIFVTSISDPFHPAVTDDMLDRIFAVMALCPQHTFQLLTKRPERMRSYLSSARAHPVGLAALEQTWLSLSRNQKSTVGIGCVLQGDIAHLKEWPLPNLWLGVSVEDQKTADERIPHLLNTPASIRFLSCEPLLGPIDLTCIRDKTIGTLLGGHAFTTNALKTYTPGGIGGGNPKPGVDWIIAGGESGPHARPMHLDWSRSLRDQCAAAGVPFFMKQMGGKIKPFTPIPDELLIREFPDVTR